MISSTNGVSLRNAALIAGLAIFFMGTTPLSEALVYNKLVVMDNAPATVKNITDHKILFATGIFAYLINFICDVLAAWALYILLKPVNKYLSLLAAWFRLIYTIISLAALLNLATVFRLLSMPGYLKMFGLAEFNVQVMLLLGAFRGGWSFGMLFFGIYLVLLGYLVFKATYIPKIMGIFLAIAGAGYLIDYSQPFFFPNINVDYIMITFFGELVFMFWLLIKGSKIKESV